MVASSALRTPGTTVLLFGPQALSFDEETFRQLRSTLLHWSSHGWILDTIAELPDCWETFSKTFPRLQAIPAPKLLDELNKWLRTGEFKWSTGPLPNILLTPLVVITELAQYARYLELRQHNSGDRHDRHAFFQSNTETLGLCTGLLSALAVSSSANQADFQRYGAVAVRLAMLIGALVDAQDASDLDGEARSLSVAWSSPETRAEMTRILKRFPQVRSQLQLGGCQP